MPGKFHELTFTDAVLKAQVEAYGRCHDVSGARPADQLTPAESAFIRSRDSFYMGTVGEGGWPYLQHRGGAPGFLQAVDPQTLAFADFGGNRQVITTGNLAGNDRVALFLMDYRHRTRLKLLGHARMVDPSEHPDLVARLVPEALRPRVERLCLIRVVAFDWNCPQHITQRYTVAEVEGALAPLRARIAELEAQLGGLPNPAPSNPSPQ